MAELYEWQLMHRGKEHNSLGSFREALMGFFKHFHRNVPFLEDLNELRIFFSLYCSIVSECPLVFTASKEELKYIKKAELTGVSRGGPMKQWPVIDWKLTFHDRSTHSWGFHLQFTSSATAVGYNSHGTWSSSRPSKAFFDSQGVHRD